MKRRTYITPTEARPGSTPEPHGPFDGAPFLPESLVRWPGFLLAWVAALAGEAYAQRLAPLGIKAQHLGILTLLASEGPLVQARIGDRLTIVKPLVVGLVNELEARGFVERRPHPTDRRAYEVYLLPAGEECMHAAEAISRSATAAFFGALSPDEQATLYQFLWRLAQSNSQPPSSTTEQP